MGLLPEMSLPTIALLALGAFVLQRIVSTVRQYYRLRHFKGPRLASVSKWWLVKTVGGQRAYLDFWEVTQRYALSTNYRNMGCCMAATNSLQTWADEALGSVARIGPNDLVTSDPDLMKHMLGARTTYSRSNWYDGMRFNPARDNCLSWRVEEEHQKLRTKMAAGYSGREVENLEAKIDKNIMDFTSLIRSYVASNVSFDLGRKAQYFTLDVISDLAFGKPFGFIETDSDVYEYIKTTEETVPMMMVTTVLPWLVKLLRSRVFKAVLPSDKDRLGFGKVMGIAKEVAAERFGPDKKVRKDMLGSFVAHGLTQPEAESEILLQIIAGSDTTATAIRSTFLHLLTSPRILHKLRTELSQNPWETPVIPDSLARTLPYLQAIVKEGLRIFPPVAGLMAKEAPPEGHDFKGQFIPGGTRIGYCAWGIFRDQEIWGKDANEYRPERWLEVSEERAREMEGTLDLIFSYGRYQCLGRPVALMELNKIFVKFVTEFDIAVCDPTRPWKVTNPGIFNQSEFWLRAFERNKET